MSTPRGLPAYALNNTPISFADLSEWNLQNLLKAVKDLSRNNNYAELQDFGINFFENHRGILTRLNRLSPDSQETNDLKRVLIDFIAQINPLTLDPRQREVYDKLPEQLRNTIRRNALYGHDLRYRRSEAKAFDKYDKTVTNLTDQKLLEEAKTQLRSDRERAFEKAQTRLAREVREEEYRLGAPVRERETQELINRIQQSVARQHEIERQQAVLRETQFLREQKRALETDIRQKDQERFDNALQGQTLVNALTSITAQSQVQSQSQNFQPQFQQLALNGNDQTEMVLSEDEGDIVKNNENDEMNALMDDIDLTVLEERRLTQELAEEQEELDAVNRDLIRLEQDAQEAAMSQRLKLIQDQKIAQNQLEAKRQQREFVRIREAQRREDERRQREMEIQRQRQKQIDREKIKRLAIQQREMEKRRLIEQEREEERIYEEKKQQFAQEYLKKREMERQEEKRKFERELALANTPEAIERRKANHIQWLTQFYSPPTFQQLMEQKSQILSNINSRQSLSDEIQTTQVRVLTQFQNNATIVNVNIDATDPLVFEDPKLQLDRRTNGQIVNLDQIDQTGNTIQIRLENGQIITLQKVRPEEWKWIGSADQDFEVLDPEDSDDESKNEIRTAHVSYLFDLLENVEDIDDTFILNELINRAQAAAATAAANTTSNLNMTSMPLPSQIVPPAKLTETLIWNPIP